ncbi:MAG: hypothetical protein PHO37_09225 [Kiritimatiellae bacterium]|nr:hypothetical protein [Kiritimatiellia bacterium]
MTAAAGLSRDFVTGLSRPVGAGLSRDCGCWFESPRWGWFQPAYGLVYGFNRSKLLV